MFVLRAGVLAIENVAIQPGGLLVPVVRQRISTTEDHGADPAVPDGERGGPYRRRLLVPQAETRVLRGAEQGRER